MKGQSTRVITLAGNAAGRAHVAPGAAFEPGQASQTEPGMIVALSSGWSGHTVPSGRNHPRTSQGCARGQPATHDYRARSSRKQASQALKIELVSSGSSPRFRNVLSYSFWIFYDIDRGT
jgi:hypothetical protein